MSRVRTKPGLTLVTGASRGIGLALAREFAAHGHNLALTSRSAAELVSLADTLRREFNIHVWCWPCDLSDRTAPTYLLTQCQRAGLDVDILVNNAAFGAYGPFIETDMALDLELLQLNVVSVMQLTKLFLAPMVARDRGHILNVASTGAFRPGPLMATYYASKAALVSWSLAIAHELSATGIRVTTLCPGPTESSFGERAGLQRSRISDKTGLVMTAERVAHLGYRGCMRGRGLVIPGWINHLQANAARFLPRWLVARLVFTMLQPK